MARALLSCVLAVVAACAGRQAAAPAAERPAIAWPSVLDHASTPDTHREAALLVLDASGMETVMARLLDVSLEMQLRQQPALRRYEKVMREFLHKHLSYAAIRDEMAKMYQDRFDELQLRQIAAFYGTPTGKLAAQKLPELAELGGELGRRRVEQNQAELVEMIQRADAEAEASPPQ